MAMPIIHTTTTTITISTEAFRLGGWTDPLSYGRGNWLGWRKTILNDAKAGSRAWMRPSTPGERFGQPTTTRSELWASPWLSDQINQFSGQRLIPPRARQVA